MLSSLSFIFLVGLAAAWLCGKLGLPRIIGMLLTGILLGPCVLGLLDPSILSVSADLRKIALIIILLKAGLSLDLVDLKKVGRPALLMSFVPACCEILCFVLFVPAVMGLTRVESAVMGAVLGAVSCALRRTADPFLHNDAKDPEQICSGPFSDPLLPFSHRGLDQGTAALHGIGPGAGRKKQAVTLLEFRPLLSAPHGAAPLQDHQGVEAVRSGRVLQTTLDRIPPGHEIGAVGQLGHSVSIPQFHLRPLPIGLFRRS